MASRNKPKDPTVRSNLEIGNARLLIRNFTGKEDRFNPPGKRYFLVAIPDDMVAPLTADGWNVKFLKPREEGDDPQPFMKVNVEYDKGNPPEVLLITQNGQQHLYKHTVGMLDWADILKVDVVISPYNWEVNGKSGVAAYLKKIYVTIVEDRFAAQYRVDSSDIEDDGRPPWEE